MQYKINSTGASIVADLAFVQAHFPGDFEEVLEAPGLTPVDPRIWQIYTGSFKDRFDVLGYPGLKGLLIGLGRTNDVCYAAFGDLVGRDYVDLLERRGELLAVFAAMAEIVVAAGKPEFTLTMQHAILETMTAESERYVKGLQP